MAKRYSMAEKAGIIAAYASSGQRLAAYSRSCGISAITLRNWLSADLSAESVGFEPIVESSPASVSGFRLSVGRATVECGSLPPAEWVSDLLKRLGV